MPQLTPLRLIEFLVQYSFFLLSVAVHESSHAWTAYRYGDPTAKTLGRISLNPLHHIDLLGTVILPFFAFISGIPVIGWAKPTPVNPANLHDPRRDRTLVSAAGPLSNLGTVAILTVFWHLAFFFAHTNHAAIYFCYVFGIGILVNLVLAVFNMLPIYPLDGSGVLEGLLPLSLARAYSQLRRFGFIMLLIFFYVPGFRDIVWMIVIFFLKLIGVTPFSLSDIR